ncbi:M1 family metallopeptidase [Sediminitomix flava]|uniref:Peptidase M1 membrane alanine aminopeptidase domain-containing protein n=1 Tax=Sediminitomix flava TaxID=379075 RepID=A0A316A245_SEDFL|nr:M1 family metallopeptidase [Sediminitomix flava]PWJ43767.1 hypothetical protein BC781_101113 [Sediminitomix flava]
MRLSRFGALMALVFSMPFFALAQENYNNSKFKQLDEKLPTPNEYRTGAGAPGHAYWQQRADYVIKAEVDETLRRLSGSETITYYNNSPDELTYLWVQLDQNVRAKDSDSHKINQTKMREKMSVNAFKKLEGFPDYDGGHKILSVNDAKGKKLPYTISKTMMRIDLPYALKSGKRVSFSIDWYYNINDRKLMDGRGGYEHFPEDGNDLYTITQWFPRMAVYDDVNGWQHKQFLGSGEFALTFGNYNVSITVPSDHIVASTGELQNPSAVLTPTQLKRFQKAKTAKRPVMIVTKEEAEENEKEKAQGTKTWVYKATNVRDFAFGSSRKYIWDAMGVKNMGKTVMAMSYYPKEAYALYSKYSTEVIAHTLNTYSKYTIPYPYPVAISVEADNGMEYPMICFNYGRTEKDGTYSERTKVGMISVIVHEVGHNYFPMIINSDERQWTWMDEGLNSFMEDVTLKEWEEGFPSYTSMYKPWLISYMKGENGRTMPIMTNSESIPQFGMNAYVKPAMALTVLRETVMGRELFDYAFKEYATRWAFKHPKPADFFRTMEDASGVDLDWFWRGWFYTTDYVDISIENVKMVEVDTKNPEKELAKKKEKRDAIPNITDMNNKKSGLVTRVKKRPYLEDFYNTYDELDVTADAKASYESYKKGLGKDEKEILYSKKYFYEVSFKNVGGLVMPLIIQFNYEDGSSEVRRIPAEIWKMGDEVVTKVFSTTKAVAEFSLDPYLETADADTENNVFPRKEQKSKFEVFKENKMGRGQSGGGNPMQKAKKKESK